MNNARRRNTAGIFILFVQCGVSGRQPLPGSLRETPYRQISCSISSFFRGSRAAGSALKVRTPIFK